MKSYLFLLAWVEGSYSASGDPTGVHSQSDLLAEYQKKNQYVFALLVKAPNFQIASVYAYTEAFFGDYTANDSVSTIILEIDGNIKVWYDTQVIEADCSES